MRLRTVSVVGFLAALCALPACIEPTLSEDERDYVDSWPSRRPSAAEPAVEYIGRVLATTEGTTLAWPATTATVRFRGTGLAWDFTEQVVSDPSHYDIILDGKVQSAYLRTAAGDQRAELAQGLSAGEHELSIVKRTEGVYSSTLSRAFVPSGDGAALLAPPVPYPHKVLFIGDSITAGYGVLGASTTCIGTPELQNARLSWASVFARRVGAEAHLVAWSGKGLVRNFNRAEPLLLPEVEKRALPMAETLWDAAAFAPDLVVLNVGTNDVGFPNSDPGPEFAEAYQSYLRALRARYPQANIAAVLGPMIPELGGFVSKLRGYIRDGAVDVLRAAGDTRVHFVELDVQSPVNGYGCESHPSKKTAKMMAHRLGRFAVRELGWTWSE